MMSNKHERWYVDAQSPEKCATTRQWKMTSGEHWICNHRKPPTVYFKKQYTFNHIQLFPNEDRRSGRSRPSMVVWDIGQRYSFRLVAP